ncbi:MAG: LCP family protein [Eubacterium sp.]|nr:LCP family protein [Eubacterium sp.]
MKKPIDPNLGNSGEEELLQDLNLNEDNKREGLFNLVDKNTGEAIPEKEDETISVQEIMDEIEVKSLKGLTDKVKTPNQIADVNSTHHHQHHHHHHHSSSSKKSKDEKKMPVAARVAIGILLFLLLAVVIACAAFFVMRYVGQTDLMKKESVNGEIAYQETIEYKGHTYQFNDDVFALAFLGVDQRTLEDVKNTDFVGATDADIVVAVNTKTGETKIIAVPRDTMVDVDIWSTSGIFLRTEKTQLCLAYAYGDGGVKSCENAINSISRILYNVPIQKYFALDLDGIAPLNDAIGGVTVQATYPLPNYNVKVGDKVTLVGDMAEAYVRTRDMDNIEASLNRTDRQMQYVKAFADQALPAVVKDFSTISRLYNTSSKYSRTNLSLNNATYVGSLLLSKGVTSFESYSIKGEMKADEDPLIPDVVHAEFYPDEDSLMETVLDVFYTQIK